MRITDLLRKIWPRSVLRIKERKKDGKAQHIFTSVGMVAQMPANIAITTQATLTKALVRKTLLVRLVLPVVPVVPVVLVPVAGGSATPSITWMTPLVQPTSAVVTFAVANFTPVLSFVMVTVCPSRVAGVCEAFKSAAMILEPLITWYLRMLARSALFKRSSLVMLSVASAAVNAVSVGAKTVKGPVPCKAVTRFALVRASAKTP